MPTRVEAWWLYRDTETGRVMRMEQREVVSESYEPVVEAIREARTEARDR